MLTIALVCSFLFLSGTILHTVSKTKIIKSIALLLNLWGMFCLIAPLLSLTIYNIIGLIANTNSTPVLGTLLSAIVTLPIIAGTLTFLLQIVIILKFTQGKTRFLLPLVLLTGDIVLFILGIIILLIK